MKAPILILIGLFVIIGFAYAPLKNAGLNERRESDPSPSSSIGTKEAESGPLSAKEIALEIKETERFVERLEEEVERKKEESLRSPYYGKVRMSNISGLRQDDPNREYVRLSTNLDTDETVKITGWYLKSEVTGYFAIIGRAALLPFPFTNTESDIILQQGDRVYLTKGFSPIGISFRTNKCTGYFEENRVFTPGLSLSCPKPITEKLPQFSSVHDRNEECLDIIERIRRCTTVNNEFLRDLPDTVSQSCKNYLKNQINYNTCVANHFSDTDFPGNEYRVYLKKFGPLWRERSDKINLHDQNGFIVDSIDY